MWIAWLLVVTCLSASVRADPCPAGSGGDACRIECGRQCNGHTGCNVDECGLMTCDCSGYGDIDVISNKCRCDAGHNPSDITTAIDCAIRLENTDCAQSQQVGTFQPPVPYAVCLSGNRLCFNGATGYSNGTFSSGVQRTTVCNPPRIGPYALKSLNPLSTSYLGVVRGARYEMALRDIGSVESSPLIGDGPLMWFTFERRSTTVPIYTIHSAFDHNRTLEMLTISGVTVIQLSHQRIHNPTVWYIPTSPHLFEPFAIYSNRDRSLHLAYTASVTAYGQYKFDLLSTAQQTSALQWYVHIGQNQLAEVSSAGYSYSTIDSVLLLPSFVIRDPLACLDHCRRDLLCNGASYRGGSCYMFSTVGAFTLSNSQVDRGWGLLSKPFSYGGKPTYCLLPSLGADCQPITIGNVRLQSGAESVTLQQDNSVISVTMGTKAFQWTNRGGTQANPIRDVVGSPNWRFVNVDNGNEYIIFPQGSNAFVLGVISGSTVGLVAYNPAAPVTWFRSGASTYRSPTGTNETISDPALWLLSSNPNLRLGFLAVTPTILSVALSSASFAVSTFRWAFNENDPFTFANRQMVGHHYESRYAPSIMHCFSSCSLSSQCRSISWYSLGKLCYMYDIPVGTTPPVPTTVAANWTSVSKSYGDVYFATCSGTGDYSTSNPDLMAYPDIYSFREPSTNPFRSTMGEAFISPARACVTPSISLMQIRLQRNAEYVIRTAHGAGVFAELRDLVTIGVYDGWRFTFRYTKDATGVFEIYSGADGYKTLEMYRGGKSEGDSDAELKLILKDVRPAQPARWRCRGWPYACDSIESFDEPGRFIHLCSSFTTFGFATPVCATYLTTYAQIVATDNKWTIGTTLSITSTKATNCAFSSLDTPIPGYSLIAEDYNACVGLAPRIAFYNGIFYDSVSRSCNIYRINTDTFSGFLLGEAFTDYCEVLPSILSTTGTNCGIYGVPANEHGCHGPTVLPNLYLTQPMIGSLGVTPEPSTGKTPFILVASGHDTNAYSICNWEQGHFTQTTDPGGYPGLYNGSKSISFYPTSCITHDPITNELSMGLIANSVPAVFQLSGLSIQSPGACVFDNVVITLNQPGPSQYLVYSPNHNPSTISAKLIDQNDVLGVVIEWSIRYYHCEQLLGTSRESPVYNIFPDFYTADGVGSSEDYLVERFVSHSVLDCQGRAIDYLLVGGFVFQPQVRGGLCSLFTNFGYLLQAGFGQTSMTASPGAVAWRRGNFGAQHGLVINPTYPGTLSGWTSDPNPSPVPAAAYYGLYAPWAPNARGYGQWSSRIGTFCTGGPADGHGRFAMTQPYAPEENGIHMTNALFPIMQYSSACSSNQWWRPWYDFFNTQCQNVGYQGVTPKSNCNPGIGRGISVVPGELWSADPEMTYILNTMVFNVVMVSGGDEAGTIPKPSPAFPGPVQYVDGLWVTLTVSRFFGLGSVDSSARKRFLCVSAKTTDSGFVEPIFELRAASESIDGYGRSFARLRDQTVSWNSVPRDCLFQLHNWDPAYIGGGLPEDPGGI